MNKGNEMVMMRLMLTLSGSKCCVGKVHQRKYKAISLNGRLPR